MNQIFEKVGKMTQPTFRLETLATLKPTSIFALDIETTGKDKRVGDCASHEHHGIAGVAISNMLGDAQYVVVDDRRQYGGVPIQSLIAFLNEKWMRPGVKVVLHNCKFDLGFLMARGLDISKVNIVDTWIMSSVLNKCAYQSNKLKDIMKERFAIDTDSEVVIKQWLENNGTEDYGDIPVDLIGPYACDDVRYTMVLFFSLSMQTDEWGAHDLLVRNMLHYNRAEARGIRINLPLHSARIKAANSLNLEAEEALRQMLGGVEVDFSNDQEMMKMLHGRGLHSPPRDYYGEARYILDDDFILSTKSDLAHAYRLYRRRQMFVDNFSAAHGRLKTRLWRDGSAVGIHPYLWPSVHAKGGIPQCKIPDLVDQVMPDADIKELFIPRDGHKFITIRFCDLPLLVAASYFKDAAFEKAVRNANAVDYLAEQAKEVPQAASLYLQKMVEGSGLGTFETRLRAAGVVMASHKNAKYQLVDRFDAAIRPGNGGTYKAFLQKVETAMRNGEMLDRGGRRVKPPEDKLWRAFAIMIQSGTGSIIAKYVDLLCRLASQASAELVMAHDKELVFEVPEGSADFELAAVHLLAQEITMPNPYNALQIQRTFWQSPYVDAHDKTSGGHI